MLSLDNMMVFLAHKGYFDYPSSTQLRVSWNLMDDNAVEMHDKLLGNMVKCIYRDRNFSLEARYSSQKVAGKFSRH